MRRTRSLLLSLALALGMVAAPAPPATTAAALPQLVAETTRIQGKAVRFVVVLDGETAYAQLKLRKHGKWRKLGQDRLDCKYWDGSHSASLEVQKADRQVLISWAGPVEGEFYAEYGGYRIRAGRINMYGVDGTCPSAG